METKTFEFDQSLYNKSYYGCSITGEFRYMFHKKKRIDKKWKNNNNFYVKQELDPRQFNIFVDGDSISRSL